MSPASEEAVAAFLLVAALAFAVIRPRRLPEAVIALPAALLLIALGILPLREAGAELGRIGPTIGFLAAVLVLAELCDRHGLFQAAGRMMAAASRGRPKRLLACVFVAGAAATAVLSLDATVVLLTPVVFATAATLRLRSKPGVYASLHLANSASLLLPVSNLTNLLAFRATKLSFPRFGLVMALPWLAAIGVERLLLSRFFASDLQGQGEVQKTVAVGAASTYALVVLGVTLVGFMLTAVIHIDPAIVAAAGAVLLAGPALARHRVGLGTLVRAVDIPFLLFVASLAILVRVVSAGGLQGIISPLVPGGTSLWSLLAVAGLAAVLANILNNLPAILILLPAASAAGVPAILAALIGVNVGANLTYVGSLATLLWRRLLRERRVELSLGEFLRLGTLTVPATLLASCVALWLSVRIIR